MSQNYTVTSVEDTKFEPSANGSKFYNVTLEGVKDRVLWSTKSRPEVNARVYGHIEPSKSGKSMIFKRDKEEAPQGNNSGAYQFVSNKPTKKSDDERSDDIRWGLCVKEAAGYITKWQENLESEQWAIQVNEYANALYKLSGGPDPEQKNAGMSEDDINDLFASASEDNGLPL